MMNLMLHSLQPSHGAVNFILAQLYIGVNTVRPQAQHEALQAARRRQQTRAFTKEYALREGIEATISQGVRAFGMRRSRYIGLAKTHLQHLGIAAGINVVRAVAWLDGGELAPTRVCAFRRLYNAA